MGNALDPSETLHRCGTIAEGMSKLRLRVFPLLIGWGRIHFSWEALVLPSASDCTVKNIVGVPLEMVINYRPNRRSNFVIDVLVISLIDNVDYNGYW